MSTEVSYTYQRVYPNGKTYTNTVKHVKTNGKRGRPKLTEAQKLEREYQKIKASYDKYKEEQLIKKGPDFIIVPNIQTPVISQP